MATLAADKSRVYEYSGEDLYNDLPVIATDIIYEGAAIGENGSGYMRPLVAGDPFVGFASAKADNSAGAAGDRYVRHRTKGLVKLSGVTGLVITSNDGAPVYASDDDTFTMTSSGNSLIGRVHRYIASGEGIINFEGVSIQV